MKEKTNDIYRTRITLLEKGAKTSTIIRHGMNLPHPIKIISMPFSGI